jgi:hypothetical protein
MVCRHWGSRNSIFKEVLKEVLKMKKRTAPLVVVSLLLLSSLAASVTAQSVSLYDGDARSFDDPPDVVAYANVNQVSPPSGVTITDSGGLWRYYEWVALEEQGDWIEAACTIVGTTAVGVQFYGDSNDGWARVLVDGTEVWTGDTYGPGVGPDSFIKYLEVSELTPGSHTVRVENMGINGAGGGNDVTIYFFGFRQSQGGRSHQVFLPLVIKPKIVASGVVRTSEEGVVQHPSGAQIYVPRGAVPLNLAGEEGEMLFTIEQGRPEDFGVPSTPPTGWAFVSDIFGMGPEGFIFETPIVATIPLPDDFDPAQYQVRMFDYDRVAGEWMEVGGRVNEDGTALSADALHLCANLLIAQQWSDKGHGAIMFDAIPGYSFKLCIESYTLKYPELDRRFRAQNRFRSIMRRDAYGCPPDGKQYWVLPQGTYTISVAVYYHRRPDEPPEYLGYFQKTIAIDHPHWDWQSGGPAPDYEFAVPFGDLAQWTNPARLAPGRPLCMGVPTPSVGVGAVNVRLEWQAEADLDLWVVDPCGNRIYWAQRQQTCQGSVGRLDLDNYCYDFVLGRPENIFWSANPPRGTYKVYVDYFADCASAGTVDYTVRWWVNNAAYSKRGTISPGEDEALVTTFTH